MKKDGVKVGETPIKRQTEGVECTVTFMSGLRRPTFPGLIFKRRNASKYYNQH